MDELDARMADTMARLEENGKEIEQAGRDLQASVQEMQGNRAPSEPTCMVEFTEAEAEAVARALLKFGHLENAARRKVKKALEVERGVGGNFYRRPIDLFNPPGTGY